MRFLEKGAEGVQFADEISASFYEGEGEGLASFIVFQSRRVTIIVRHFWVAWVLFVQLALVVCCLFVCLSVVCPCVTLLG